MSSLTSRWDLEATKSVAESIIHTFDTIFDVQTGLEAAKSAAEAIINMFTSAFWRGERAGRFRGEPGESPRRAQGGNDMLGGPRLRSNYVTTNEVTEDLSRRWARGPANFGYMRMALGILERLGGHFGVTLGLLWGHYGVTWAPFWVYDGGFGILFGDFRRRKWCWWA